MTVAEIMEQAKTLTAQERKELVKRLVDTLDAPISAAPDREKHSILELAGLGAEVWKDAEVSQTAAGRRLRATAQESLAGVQQLK